MLVQLHLKHIKLVFYCSWIHGYQNTEYKTEPVWYSTLSTYGATYIIACHCLSSLDLKILRVVAATVISESEFESYTILWLNGFQGYCVASVACPYALWLITLQLSERITWDLADLSHS